MSSPQGAFQEGLTDTAGKSFEDIYDAYLSEPEAALGQLSLQVATTTSEIEKLRPVWRKWAHSLETDVDYFLHNLKNDSGILHPYAATVFKDGVPRGMLLGQVRQRRASTVVSFLNIYGPKVRVLEIARGGRLGRPSPVIDKMLAMQLLKTINSRQVDLLCLRRLPLDSELFRHVQQSPGFLVKERVPHVFHYSVLSLTCAKGKHPEVFSGKALREVRRKTRILERAFPGQVQMRCFCHASDMHTGLRDALRVAVNTWQSHVGSSLSDCEKTRREFQFFTQKGWLRIYVLYVQQFPCAYLVGQLYNGTFYCQYAGYHSQLSHLSVGSVLTARAFEDLAAVGVQRVDLGEGAQEHNRRLGCHMSEEGTVHLYAPTLRGVWSSVFFGTTQIVRSVGRRTCSELRLNWLAKTWHQFLLRRKFRGRVSEPPACGAQPV
jgi:hypothetical protein